MVCSALYVTVMMLILIYFDVFLCYYVLAIIVHHLFSCFVGEGSMVGGECPLDAFGKVSCILVMGHIAIDLMVYHLRYAAHVEAHAGCAACHGFHDGVGQVVL